MVTVDNLLKLSQYYKVDIIELLESQLSKQVSCRDLNSFIIQLNLLSLPGTLLEEMRMALGLVLNRMIRELKAGNNVCFDDFRMSRAFLKRLGGVVFERVPPGFYKNKKKTGGK